MRPTGLTLPPLPAEEKANTRLMHLVDILATPLELKASFAGDKAIFTAGDPPFIPAGEAYPVIISPLSKAWSLVMPMEDCQCHRTVCGPRRWRNARSWRA